jgi:signal transduction histidine kinase
MKSDGEAGPSRSVFRLRSHNYLLGERTLADGRRIELAMPLASFHAEAIEIALALAVLAVLSGVAALAVAGAAITVAFSPLRRATQLVDGIDTRTLGRRLPSRGTGDPVDRHAEAVNRLLEEVDRSFERLRSFSADAAHELRTPLNRLQNLVEVALLGGDETDLKNTLERVHVAAQELSHTVRSLLLLAELDDHRVELRIAALDLDAWLADFVTLHAPLFEEGGARIQLHGRVGVLDVDRHLLDRVMGNLLDNAYIHARAGGQVELRASRTESCVTIEVDDAGPGIPESQRERAFDRFARLDTARSGAGTGLGLAVARACARAGGGELRIGDSRLGGACFVFEIRSRSPVGSEPPARDR